MAYINGLGQSIKGQRQELSFDKGAFLFATDFATNIYFANDLNWNKIALHFTDETNSQKQVVILMDDGSRGWFAPSVMSRTGDWTIEKIQIFDKDGDYFEVKKADIPNANTIKATVTRVVAPIGIISSFQNNNQTIVSTDATSWKVGFKFRLWDTVANSYLDAITYTITEVVNQNISLDTAIVADVTGKTLIMRFPNYSDVSGEQASKYEYVGVGY